MAALGSGGPELEIFHVNQETEEQRHISREVLGSESDPDAVLASLPIGTSDWIRVLGAILKKHNFKHSKKHKGVGFKTMLDRQRFYASFFRELRRHTPYHNVDPRQLANRHIEAVLARCASIASWPQPRSTTT